MNEHADKTKGDKREVTIKRSAENKASGDSALQFEYGRAAALKQKELQAAADESPRVKQLKELRRMAESEAGEAEVGHLRAGGQVAQRHLFVDSPEDFTKLEDMGMWWGMACEWRNVKNLYGANVSDNRKDYITSLVDVSAAAGKLEKD